MSAHKISRHCQICLELFYAKLPGQCCSLHAPVSFSSPSQSFPPCNDPSHVRVLVLVPLPHVLLQACHSPNADHFPSTENYNGCKIIYLSYVNPD